MAMRRMTLILVSLLALSPAARAQTDAAQRENAQALYKAGNDARDAGDMKTAAAKYKIAYTLVQTPVIAVALGKAQAAIGQLIEGRQTLIGVASIPIKPHESTLTTNARADAVLLAAQIEPRIPTLTLELTTPRGAPAPTVTVDGVSIPEVALSAPWKVDPGPHTVVVTVQEAKTETQVSVEEAEAREVPLDYPVPFGVPPPDGPIAAPTPQPTVPVGIPVATPGRKPSRVPAYVALGVGGAGVIVTAVAGAIALHDKSALDSACKPLLTDCPGSSQSDIDGLHTSSIVSDVGLGVAIAGLGVGGALLLFRHGSSDATPAPDRATGVQLDPWVGLGALGITGKF
jgi:hypothetical protein